MIESILFSLVCILIVLAILGVISLIIVPLKYLSIENPKEPATTTSDSIDDEDKMVAALIAAIDFKEATGKEPELKSIKEIKQ